LVAFAKKHARVAQTLLAWYDEAVKAVWQSPHDIKHMYASASILGAKRVVFNIPGNEFRLIVDAEYRLGIVYIVWIGSHKEYDKIDAKAVKHLKAN
jgi:mRNA interferase HigB